MSSEIRNSDVTQRGLLRLSWPLLVEWFFLNATGLADTWISSRISDAAAAAAGSVFLILMVLSSALSAIAQGGGILMAQMLGAGRREECAESAGSVLLMCGGIGLLISAAVAVFRGAIISGLGLPADIVADASIYLLCVGVSLVLAELGWALSTVLNVQGLTSYSMAATLTSNAVRLGTSYALVVGLFGLPRLGMWGIGLGAVASRVLAVVMLAVIVRLKSKLPVRWPWSFARLIERATPILRVGLPTLLEPLSYHGAQVLLIAMIASFGAHELAVRSYVSTVASVSEVPLWAFGTALQILAGHYIGARDYAGVRDSAGKGLFWILGAGLLCGGALVLFRREIFHVFSSDHDVIAIGATVLVLAAVLLPLKGINMVVGSVLRAAGDTKFLAGVSVLFMWLLFLPTAFVFCKPLQLGIVGVWVAMICDEILRAIALGFRLRSFVSRKALPILT